MIKPVQDSDFERCIFVIRESFATVAREFNLTRDNCPTHTSFLEIRNLEYHRNNGFLMFGFFKDDEIIGYVSLSRKDDNTFELHNLAVLPEYRHFGYGEELLAFCMGKVRELGGSLLKLGTIEENTKLKNWYACHGFVHTGTKRFDYLPFTVGFMEMNVKYNNEG